MIRNLIIGDLLKNDGCFKIHNEEGKGKTNDLKALKILDDEKLKILKRRGSIPISLIRTDRKKNQ